MTLLTALSLNLQHVRDIHLVWLQALHFMLLRLLYTVSIHCVFQDYSVKTRKVDVLGLRVVG
jgi:hypothetical protein